MHTQSINFTTNGRFILLNFTFFQIIYRKGNHSFKILLFMITVDCKFAILIYIKNQINVLRRWICHIYTLWWLLSLKIMAPQQAFKKRKKNTHIHRLVIYFASAPKKLCFVCSSYHNTATREEKNEHLKNTYALQINMLFVISLSHNVMTHTNVY